MQRDELCSHDHYGKTECRYYCLFRWVKSGNLHRLTIRNFPVRIPFFSSYDADEVDWKANYGDLYSVPATMHLAELVEGAKHSSALDWLSTLYQEMYHRSLFQLLAYTFWKLSLFWNTFLNCFWVFKFLFVSLIGHKHASNSFP